MTAAGRHIPASGKAIPLGAPRRWVAVLGAVGQPRDGNPAACFGLFDDAANTLAYVRVPYDAEVTARKVKSRGLPEALAVRLVTGR
jgi:diadenosine tetraphosphatase ApaH/serine/threonine PP2A family protein phosphatase